MRASFSKLNLPNRMIDELLYTFPSPDTAERHIWSVIRPPSVNPNSSVGNGRSKMNAAIFQERATVSARDNRRSRHSATRVGVNPEKVLMCERKFNLRSDGAGFPNRRQQSSSNPLGKSYNRHF